MHTDQPRGRWAEKRSWLIPETVDEDGEPIVDVVAVRIMVRGTRKVRSTNTERRRAVFYMLTEGLTILDMCEHIGCRPQEVIGYLDDLGFEVIDDTLTSKSFKRKAIVPKDRPRGQKILTGTDIHLSDPTMATKIGPRGSRPTASSDGSSLKKGGTYGNKIRRKAA